MTEHHDAPGARIPIDSVPNLRDVGGWAVAGGGHVRRGLLYRSMELDALSDADLPRFGELGLRTVFDLRTAAERTAKPDRALPDVRAVVLDVLADSTDAAPAEVLGVLGDPAAAERMLGGGRAVELFESAYREIVSLPSAIDSYHRFFRDLVQPETNPALFHCTTGKDRTGWASAALLLVLGVDESDVMREYLLTNEQLLPSIQPIFDGFAAAGGDPDLLRPVLGVKPEYLRASLKEMRTRFGGIEGYFSEGLQLGPEVLAALRGSFIAHAD